MTQQAKITWTTGGFVQHTGHGRKLHVTVPNIEWVTSVEDGVIIGYSDGYTCHRHTVLETPTEHTGTFTVEIDVGAIVQEMVARAASNASTRATWLGGKIKCRGIATKTVRHNPQQHPLPQDAKVLREARPRRHANLLNWGGNYLAP